MPPTVHCVNTSLTIIAHMSISTAEIIPSFLPSDVSSWYHHHHRTNERLAPPDPSPTARSAKYEQHIHSEDELERVQRQEKK